jgi:hypothetical protein
MKFDEHNNKPNAINGGIGYVVLALVYINP